MIYRLTVVYKGGETSRTTWGGELASSKCEIERQHVRKDPRALALFVFWGNDEDDLQPKSNEILL